MAEQQARVVEALSRPELYPGRPGRVEVRETHISFVFLAGERAYKLKKALVLPFVDYGTRERRRAMCLEEVRLNRRLAPSVYLGVRSVAEVDGELRLEAGDHPRAVEHVVEMRRFDESSTLAARIARAEAGAEEIDAVARRIAEFHASVPSLPAVDPVAGMSAAADETFATLRDAGSPDERGERFVDAFLAARGDELRARARQGLVRDGHGDLRLEHVLLDGELVEVVDCVEFDPALRALDVGADLSFLVMDLARVGEDPLARRLVEAYRASGGDPGDDALVAFAAAHRARVRAKVALVRALQLGNDGAPGAEAAELLELARRLSWRARQPLVVVVCGLSGSGKSTLAGELARVSGVRVLSSDRVRKRLAGVEASRPAPPDAYSSDFGRRTYAELGRLARDELESGGVAIVDGTFRRAADRAVFFDALGRGAERCRFVECTAPREVLLERAGRRAGGVSDATPEVVAAQRFEPLEEMWRDRRLAVSGEAPLDAVADEIEEWLDGRGRTRPA